MTTNSNSQSPLSKVYDLLTSDGQAVGVGTKQEANEKGLYRGTVHILLQDPDGKILICKRPSSARVYPDMWSSSAGGHIELGESHLGAAHRELKEELGYTSKLTYLGKSRIEMPERKNVQYLYKGVFKNINELVIDPTEIANTDLLKTEAIKNKLSSKQEAFTQEFIAAFNLFSEANGSI